jgi:hypothetical protein
MQPSAVMTISMVRYVHNMRKITAFRLLVERWQIESVSCGGKKEN